MRPAPSRGSYEMTLRSAGGVLADGRGLVGLARERDADRPLLGLAGDRLVVADLRLLALDLDDPGDLLDRRAHARRGDVEAELVQQLRRHVELERRAPARALHVLRGDRLVRVDRALVGRRAVDPQR